MKIICLLSYCTLPHYPRHFAVLPVHVTGDVGAIVVSARFASERIACFFGMQ